MNNRERNWYEGKYGKHPESCRCPDCEARKHQPYNDIGYDTAREDRERYDVGDKPEMDSGPGNTSEGSTVEGRAWWGNSYFDPKSGRWRTPGDFIASSDLPPWSTAKLGLGVLILVGFGFLVWFGYRVFTEQTGSLWEPVVLLLGLTAWMLVVWFTRSRFRRLHPGFGSVIVLVVSVLVALSFLGVQPLSTYKDVVVGFLLSVSTG